MKGDERERETRDIVAVMSIEMLTFFCLIYFKLRKKSIYAFLMKAKIMTKHEWNSII